MIQMTKTLTIRTVLNRFSVALALTMVSTASLSADVLLDRIVAVVNEGVVLSSELDAEMAFLKLQAQSNGQSLPGDDVFRERVLERMINQEVQRQHASQLGIVVDASSVNQAIQQVANGNNMELSQFRQAITAQGLSYSQYRKSIEHELLLTRLVQRDVQSGVRVSTQEIDDFIAASKKVEQQRYRVQHILIAVAPSASQTQTQAALSRAETVLARLRAGSDFAETAAAVSDGARALEGGDLGWRELQELPDFLSEALVSMSVGEISEPLRSQNGFHIVKLNNKGDLAKEARTETLARHIFLAAETENAPQQLDGIRQRLLAGESFDNLAAEFSEDPNSASNGGELPWFADGQMPPEIESVASQLQTGIVSEPFRTQFGWHILEVLDRRTRNSSDQSQRDQAERALRQRKIEQATERWIRRLRDESFIEVRG